MLEGGPIFNDDNNSPYANPFYTHQQQVYDGMLLVPLADDVYMPYMRIAGSFTNPWIVKSLKKAHKNHEPVLFYYASDTQPEDLSQTTLADVQDIVGVIGYVDTVQENPDKSLQWAANMMGRGRIYSVSAVKPLLRGDVEACPTYRAKTSDETEETWKAITEVYSHICLHLSENDKKSLEEILTQITPRTLRHLNFMIQNSPLNAYDRYELLTVDNTEDRMLLLYDMITREMNKLNARAAIHQKTAMSMSDREKEEFLRAEMRHIQDELGESEDSETNELEERAKKKEWNKETAEAFKKEFRRLMRYAPNSPEYAMQYAYLDTFLDLPWEHCDRSTFTLDKVEEILNRDHYGLDKVKERVIEQMAVLKLRNDMKAPILCLYGPPGVGKTSLGKSIAEALGRKYVRVALGGVHDEAEIRGHRRTYLGSMPGRIIAALEKCGTSDPVMVLDEIDKIGADFKGDPSTALLEVLDPEQNCKFHDNYIDHDYDLSKVLFIATANSLETVSHPLLDRMELIAIDGYVEDEKVQIAKKHLIPKNLKEHGFAEDEITFTDDALMEIISSYTRESGVRRMEKKINDVLRKLARLKAGEKEYPREITLELVKEYLGKPEAFPDKYENNDIPGIVTGLAWTQAGGEILFIESSEAPAKESKLTLTGNLGDVMKESAVLALQYIKANAARLGIPQEKLETGLVHVHVPEGAVPKDGPSAGITIVTSLASTFTGRKVRSHVAMTGEITLRGKVLPVGGIKEKILAAKRAGIKTVVLCEKNRKDVEEIKPEYLAGLDFHFVESVEEVLDFALLP